jgi:hypothetical protein
MRKVISTLVLAIFFNTLIGQSDKTNEKKFLEDNKVKIAEYQAKEKKRENDILNSGGMEMNNEIIRTFQIEGFRIWNTDRIIKKKGFDLVAKFNDQSGKKLKLDNIVVVSKETNSVFNYTNSSIKNFTSTANMIWSVVDNKFVYLSFDDFMKCKIDSTTKENNFVMMVHPNKIFSKDDIRKIIGI